ncbi:MAG: thioredoxin family protein [Crocinitomicaceae bacterium]|nr:thioredoxin family protein [Crocinitomicaceae bacterium]
MKKSMILLLALFFSIGLQAKGIQFEELSLDEAKSKAKKENKIIFIDYYADWCGPCKWLAKNVFTEDEVGTLFNDNFINLKINADHDDFIGREYNSSALPTLLFIDHEGNLKKKVVGAVDKETLIAQANYVINPDSDPIAIKQKEFDGGKRDKDFLFEFAVLLSEAEIDFDFVVKAYQEANPNLDLSDITDFTFFFLEDVRNNKSQLLDKFISGFSGYYEDEERKSMAVQKLINIYVFKIEQDAEEKNATKRDQHIEELSKFVSKNKIKEIDKEKISEAFIAYYKEKLNE